MARSFAKRRRPGVLFYGLTVLLILGGSGLASSAYWPALLEDEIAHEGPAAPPPALKVKPRPVRQAVTPRPQATPRPARRAPARFSFAVISDTHERVRCDKDQGKAIPAAIKLLHKLRPAFVVGVGDLISGGGDCKGFRPFPGSAGAAPQLAELNRRLLRPLRIPFVPVGGNHDLDLFGSDDQDYPTRLWNQFWWRHRREVLGVAQRRRAARSYRFRYRGMGFAILGYRGSYGLEEAELGWIRRHVRGGDLVFRHVNPYGISCAAPGRCGFGLRSTRMKNYEALTTLLKRKRIAALFSGHTHAFYDGDCDGLRFINTGALGGRAMEYLRGWDNSRWRNRRSFVLVDVYGRRGRRRIAVRFFVYSDACDCFRAFDKSDFPAVVESQRLKRRNYEEGVAARCISRRR